MLLDMKESIYIIRKNLGYSDIFMLVTWVAAMLTGILFANFPKFVGSEDLVKGYISNIEIYQYSILLSFIFVFPSVIWPIKKPVRVFIVAGFLVLSLGALTVNYVEDKILFERIVFLLFAFLASLLAYIQGSFLNEANTLRVKNLCRKKGSK
jgi:hypothetical protein